MYSSSSESHGRGFTASNGLDSLACPGPATGWEEDHWLYAGLTTTGTWPLLAGYGLSSTTSFLGLKRKVEDDTIDLQ